MGGIDPNDAPGRWGSPPTSPQTGPQMRERVQGVDTSLVEGVEGILRFRWGLAPNGPKCAPNCIEGSPSPNATIIGQ